MGGCWTKFLGSKTDSDGDIPSGDLASGNVLLITTIQHWEEKLSEANRDGKINVVAKQMNYHGMHAYSDLEALVVANFSASWCNPCRLIAPAYCELADKYPSMIFLTVDVDELAEFSSSWEIKATPTFFFLKDGRQMDKLVGANKMELQKKIAGMAASVAKSK